uniref:Interleukin-3 receptor subunit alpha n=1 Tax=Rhinopithecus roxellana TaxID=61622 RepID=A0A2K6Q0X9_RHIRO
MVLLWLTLLLVATPCLLQTKEGGTPRAGAENLTCWVHDVDFLSCSWAVGPAAPADVQYDLYLNNLNSHEQHKCLHYNTDARGTRIGCRFDDIARLSSGSQRSHILVRGRSAAFSIPCTDQFVVFSQIERLTPPHMTAECNKTHSFMQWKMRSHFNRKFRYELQIQKRMQPVRTEQVRDTTSFQLPNPGTYTVQIRARETVYEFLSAWSTPQRFECDPEEGASSPAWRTSLPIALGTLLAVLCVFLICRRYLVMQRLFPRIPHMKDPIGDSFQDDKLVIWEAGKAGLEECLVSEVQVVEKT